LVGTSLYAVCLVVLRKRGGGYLEQNGGFFSNGTGGRSDLKDGDGLTQGECEKARGKERKGGGGGGVSSGEGKRRKTEKKTSVGGENRVEDG